MEDTHALLADIVGSRELPDRAASQAAILDTLLAAADGLGLVQPPRATVGDEFQAIAATLGDALTLTLRVQLMLPGTLRLRFGIGAGRVVDVDTGDAPGQGAPRIQDGSAWWAAREAIEHVHALEDAGHRYARTWLAVGTDAAMTADEAATTNALLLVRDHVTHRMKPKERRIASALLLGATQSEVARGERISQPSVSESAHRSGASALLEAQRALGAVTTPGRRARPSSESAPRREVRP